MIHIKRNPRTKQFRVVYAGKNGEVLAVSESLKSKQSAYKNIDAMYPDSVVLVQDNTLLVPIVYERANGSQQPTYAAPVECKYKF